jgi:hypothetical protein
MLTASATNVLELGIELDLALEYEKDDADAADGEKWEHLAALLRDLMRLAPACA